MVTVAITRPRERAAETEALVRSYGWKALVVPAIEIVPREIDPSLKLEGFDWLVVTSGFGAELVCRHFKESVGRVKIAVVGPKTAAAFEKRGFKVELVARQHVGEALAEELLEKVRGRKVLVARAAIARRELVEMLSKAAEVTELPLYDTVMPSETGEMERLRSLVSAGELDALVLTSSQATRNLLSYLGEGAAEKLKRVLICAIGPVTARTAREQGLNVACVPRNSTLEAALEELSRRFGSLKDGGGRGGRGGL